MKIFVTGASGYVGSTVVKELLQHGHEVLGLAHSDESEEKIKKTGAEAHRGDLNDVESLKAGTQQADAVIHTGFIHDFSRFKEVCEIDRKAILAMGEVLEGSDWPFIVTSAVAPVADGGVIKEEDRATKDVNPRVATEQAVDELAAKGVRVAIVRLPPSVHGEGDSHGFIPTLVKIARGKGKAAYISNGSNNWSAVNRWDVAPLFRLALEKNPAPGTRYHAVAEQEIAFKDIATAIGKSFDIPVTALEESEAEDYFATFTHFAKLHAPTSSQKTQNDLGWKPQHSTLIEDIENNIYK